MEEAIQRRVSSSAWGIEELPETVEAIQLFGGMFAEPDVHNLSPLCPSEVPAYSQPRRPLLGLEVVSERGFDLELTVASDG